MVKIEQKETAYDNFILLYGQNLEKLRSALHYLNTYSSEIKSLKIDNLVKSDKLDSHLKEWVWLVYNYDGLDKDHFKPYWIPIQTEEYSFFIDLSDENLPVFETTYFIYEPYSYFNTVIFTSVKDLMIAIEENADFTEISKRHFNNVITNFRLKLVERNKFIFEGIVPIDPVNIFEATDEEELIPFFEEFDGKFYFITCSNVNAQICGLLPFDLPVKLISSDFDHANLDFFDGFDLSIIRSIKDLVHTCRMYRPRNLHSYTCILSGNADEFILYRNDTFTLKTSNINNKTTFVESYKALMQESSII